MISLLVSVFLCSLTHSWITFSSAQNDNLQVHEEKSKGVYVKNLSDYYVSSAKEVYEIMRTGGAARVVTSTSESCFPDLFSNIHICTDMNAESSRSHSIFLITIQQRNTETGALKTGNLYLVDLAGSEKVGKTGASGQTLEEAKKINKSLSALGMVINALTDSKVWFIASNGLQSADLNCLPLGETHPLPRFQAHPYSPRVTGRKLKNDSHHQLLSFII